MLPKIIIGAVVILLALFAWYTFAPKQLPSSQHAPEQTQPRNQQQPPTFYSKGGLSFTHSWPGEGNFSAEETEILLFNESNSSFEVKSFDLTYSVEGKTYPHKSGTWEKFARKDSPEKIEYLNISPQYYKGEKLLLNPGQKGKLHWHIQFGPNPLDGKQTVAVKLTLLKDGQAININEQFHRDSGTVFSKGEH